MKNCKYCERPCKNENSLRNHERLCKSNPDKQTASLENARKKGQEKHKCSFCDEKIAKTGLSTHEKACKSNPIVIQEKTKICPVCDKEHMKVGTTCSYSCSNTHFRHLRNNPEKYKQYTTICFHHHKKKCIICPEDKIVAVHHYDGNNKNNDPRNLIPMCPTHHQYIHSRYADEVQPKIDEYVERFINMTV